MTSTLGCTRVGVAVLAGFALLASTTGAQERPVKDLSAIRRQQRELDAEYIAAETEIKQALESALGEAQVTLGEQLRQLPYDFAPRYIETAQLDPAHEDAFGPLLWCIVKLDSSKELDAAIVLLGEHLK